MAQAVNRRLPVLKLSRCASSPNDWNMAKMCPNWRNFFRWQRERMEFNKARRVLSALIRIGWSVKRQSGSHRTLTREGWENVTFAFNDNDEIGPVMLSRIAKKTGLSLNDL